MDNVTLPAVDLSTEEGTSFKNENRSYVVADESEFANVSLPKVKLDEDDASSFTMEKVGECVPRCPSAGP